MKKYRIQFLNEDRRPITIEADEVREESGRHTFLAEGKLQASFVNINFYPLGDETSSEESNS